MYEIRQIIARLRLGESDRAIARTQRTGRATVTRIRRVAEERGWLDPAGLLPARFTVIELMGPDLSIVPGSGFSVEVVRPPGQLGSWRPQSEHTTELGVDQPIFDSQGVR